MRPEVEQAAIFGEDRVIRATTLTGDALACDTVIVAAGMTANSELARAAGLRVGRGVIVDDRMRTSDPDISPSATWPSSAAARGACGQSP